MFSPTFFCLFMFLNTLLLTDSAKKGKISRNTQLSTKCSLYSCLMHRNTQSTRIWCTSSTTCAKCCANLCTRCLFRTYHGITKAEKSPLCIIKKSNDFYWLFCMVRPNLPALELHTILNHRLTSSPRNK
jgi:hypothetical protein